MAMEQYTVAWTYRGTGENDMHGGLTLEAANNFKAALIMQGHIDVTVELERPLPWTGIVLAVCVVGVIAACLYGCWRSKRVAVACDADTAMLAVKVALMAPTTDAEYAEAREWAMSK